MHAAEVSPDPHDAIAIFEQAGDVRIRQPVVRSRYVPCGRVQRNTPLFSCRSRASHRAPATAPTRTRSCVYSVNRGTNRPSRNSATGPQFVPTQMVPSASCTIEPIQLLDNPSAVEYVITRFGLRRASPPLAVATHTLPSGSS